MYKSPIELLVDDIQHQIVKQQDEDIYQAVLHYIPNVDKEELLRALRYDRDQYNKGHLDGYADAMAELVRCKDCRKCSVYDDAITRVKQYRCYTWNGYRDVSADFFCAAGERREGE